MKVLTWQGNQDVQITEVPDPAAPLGTMFRAEKDGCIKVVLNP